MKYKQALITGASGFIGKYIQRESIEQGYETETLHRSEAATYRIDLTEQVPKFPREYDLVVHVAGSSKDELADAVNRQGTKNLLKGLEKTPPKCFVYISSASVYGIIEGENINESFPLKPNSEYGKSKLAAEEQLRSWCSEHDVVLTILRPVMTVGTGMTGQLSAMARGIARGYYFNIKASTVRRSIIHAIDIAKVTFKIAPIGGTYNINDGTSPLINDIAEALSTRMKSKRIPTMPIKTVRFIARIGDIFGKRFPLNSNTLQKLTETLTFDTSAIHDVIDWRPINVVEYLKTHDYENDGLDF